MRVSFYTLGCKVNQNETGALQRLFEQNGYLLAAPGESADVYVVNSCTVTNFGDQKSRKWLRRAKRENPGAVTVLTGCYPQAFPAEAAAIAEEAKRVSPQKAEVSFEDFSAMDIRTATVLEAERVPKTDKLLKLTIEYTRALPHFHPIHIDIRAKRLEVH